MAKNIVDALLHKGNRFYQSRKDCSISIYTSIPLFLGSCSTCDNLDQLAGNDGLTSSVEENLVLADHISGVLGGVLQELAVINMVPPAQTYIHSVTTGRLLAGVAFGKSPEERVGQGVFTEVAESLILNLECREVGYKRLLA